MSKINTYRRWPKPNPTEWMLSACSFLFILFFSYNKKLLSSTWMMENRWRAHAYLYRWFLLFQIKTPRLVAMIHPFDDELEAPETSQSIIIAQADEVISRLWDRSAYSSHVLNASAICCYSVGNFQHGIRPGFHDVSYSLVTIRQVFSFSNSFSSFWFEKFDWINLLLFFIDMYQFLTLKTRWEWPIKGFGQYPERQGTVSLLFGLQWDQLVLELKRKRRAQLDETVWMIWIELPSDFPVSRDHFRASSPLSFLEHFPIPSRKKKSYISERQRRTFAARNASYLILGLRLGF